METEESTDFKNMSTIDDIVNPEDDQDDEDEDRIMMTVGGPGGIARKVITLPVPTVAVPSSSPECGPLGENVPWMRVNLAEKPNKALAPSSSCCFPECIY